MPHKTLKLLLDLIEDYFDISDDLRASKNEKVHTNTERIKIVSQREIIKTLKKVFASSDLGSKFIDIDDCFISLKEIRTLFDKYEETQEK